MNMQWSGGEENTGFYNFVTKTTYKFIYNILHKNKHCRK